MLPCLVACRDPFQDVTRKDGEELLFVIVEIHEAAARGEILVERAQLRADFERLDGLERLGFAPPQRIELEVVFENPPEAFEDAAGEL